MEICQHCGMYMKPFIPKRPDIGNTADCEFCDKPIAIIVEKDGKRMWEKVVVVSKIKI